MSEILAQLTQWASGSRAATLAQGALIFVVGLAIARLVEAAVGRAMARRATAQQLMIARKAARYGISVLAALSALTHVGVDLSIFVGAAGILTISLGFASQTSASNLISGIFLMGEQPFVVGDIIQVGATTGEVISIDLLSVKLRTFDNLLVRLPNESLLKSEITNVTHFPIRRINLLLNLSLDEDVARVRRVLEDLADRNPLCLDEPVPALLFLGLSDTGLSVQFNVWALSPNFLELRNSMFESIKAAFDREGIELALPRRILHTQHASALRALERAPAATPEQMDSEELTR